MTAASTLRTFELEWCGGPIAARAAASRRRGGPEIPWGTLALHRYDEASLLEARKVWTNGAFTEYASAAAFSSLTGAMLACGAPVDLVAVTASAVGDELAHVELASRLVMEFGGATPYHVDLANVAPLTTEGVRPLLVAAEIAITTSVVAEALSVPILARSHALATEPLVRAILATLARDEGQHARIGAWFLAWAEPQLSPGDRAFLAGVAADALDVYAPLWREPRCATCTPHEALGGLSDEAYRRTLRTAVTRRVLPTLRDLGIELAPERLDALALRASAFGA